MPAISALLTAALLLGSGHGTATEELIRPGDRIAIVGNTFAERLGLFGDLEAVLRLTLPRHELRVRNLGWSADTVTLRPRPLNFGDTLAHLEQQGPSVVLFCFGMVESFDGEEGREAFEQGLAELLRSVGERSFDGVAPPRLIVLSPILHENLDAPLPAPGEHNADLARYTESMRRVAEAEGARFVDLFARTQALSAEDGQRLTLNGIHPTRYGSWALARSIAEELGVRRASFYLEVDVASGQTDVVGATASEARAEAHGFDLRLETRALAVPPAPRSAAIHASLRDPQPVVVVRGLTPGPYRLLLDGVEVASGTNEDWEKGIGFDDAPGTTAAEELRRIVVEKDRDFFLRHRPVNGEYVFGRRKEPFGVVNFPEEMRALDALIEERELDLDTRLEAGRVRRLVLERMW